MPELVIVLFFRDFCGFDTGRNQSLRVPSQMIKILANIKCIEICNVACILQVFLIALEQGGEALTECPGSSYNRTNSVQ